MFVAMAIFLLSAQSVLAANLGNSAWAKAKKVLTPVETEQVNTLEQQMELTKTQTKSITKALNRTLKKGVRGEDVEILQTLLALDPVIYPEAMVTGYFGSLTEKALIKFQNKYGLKGDGVAGPMTREALEKDIDTNDLDVEADVDEITGKASWKVCDMVPPGHYIAKGWQKNNPNFVLPTCETLPLGIQMNLAKISQITEGEDETVAVIDNIAVEDETNTTALISWRTRNERTSSEIHYGTASGTLNIIAEDLSFSNSHEMTLSGLNPDTTNYFVIKAIDKDGNEVISAQQELKTDEGDKDTKSPEISGIEVEESNTSVKISWKTDELSDGKVYLSTTSDFPSTATSTAKNLSLNHFFTLEGLTKNIKYYYKIESTDGALNISSQYGSFTTLNEAEADETDPVISGVATIVSGTSVTITWVTNEATIGKFQHSLNKNYTDPFLAPNTILGTSHTTTLAGLTPDTKYYYKIEATDLSGNTDTYKGTFNIK